MRAADNPKVNQEDTSRRSGRPHVTPEVQAVKWFIPKDQWYVFGFFLFMLAIMIILGLLIPIYRGNT